MTEQPPSTSAAPNRRADSRHEPRARVKVECRKGSAGLGQNLATQVLDLSQLGAKITTKAELPVGAEVEISLLAAAFQRPVKVMANVVRSETLKDGSFRVGVRFQKPVSYADIRLLTNF